MTYTFPTRCLWGAATVSYQVEEVGREAVRQLVRLLNGKQIQGLTLMRTELAIRKSCGCP